MDRRTALRRTFSQLMFAGIVALASGLSSTRVMAYPQDTELKPILVVSVNNFNALVANLKFLGTPSRDDRYLDKITRLSTLLTKKQGEEKGEGIDLGKAEGIDQDKPLGTSLLTDGQGVRQLAFLPVTDAEAVFKWLKPLVGEVKKNDSGVYEIASERLTAWVKVENGYMFWALSAEQLDPLPDPAKSFDDLPGKFDFAMRLSIANIPEAFRSIVIDQLRTRLESADSGGDAASPLAAFRRETNAFGGRLFDRFANDTEHVTFGANFAKDTTQIKGQVIVKPVAGSSLATHFTELGTQTTRFGGLSAKHDKAVLSLGMTGKLAPEVVTDTKAEVEAYRTAIVGLIDASDELQSPEDKQLFKDLGGAMVDSIQSTLDQGRLDIAVRMAEGENRNKPSTLVAAIEIVGGDAILKQLDRLAEATKDDANSGFKVDEATYESVRISSFVTPKGPEMATVIKYFGESKLYLAVNDKTLYTAYGPRALELIKEAITTKPQEGVEPLRVSGKAVVLSRIMQPSGGEGNLALLMGVVGQQLASGDGFEALGHTVDGNLVVDFTLNKGFVGLFAFATPVLGQIILPNLDLNNPGALLGF